MNIQEHIDAILSVPVFSGELYYIQHPDPDGKAKAVADLYGVYTIVGGESYETLEGDTGIERPRVQISVYAIDTVALVAAVAAVNAAMMAAAILAQTSDPDMTAAALFNFSPSVPVDGFEEETRRYYSHMDFNCGN
jgi:hypothetical protein